MIAGVESEIQYTSREYPEGQEEDHEGNKDFCVHSRQVLVFQIYSIVNEKNRKNSSTEFLQ